MTDAEPARASREAPVGDQCHALAHAEPVERGGGGQHLAHSGPAARPLVADDDDLPFLDLALDHRVESILLAVEHPRGAVELQTLQTGDLHDRAFRCQAALEPDDAPRRRQRPGHPVEDILVLGEFDVRVVLAEGLARHRRAVAFEQPRVHQLLDHHANAARLVHRPRGVLAARHQVGDVGRLLEDLRDVVERVPDARLVGDRRQMQPGIGRPAGRGDDLRRVVERLPGDYVSRADSLAQRMHRGASGRLDHRIARFVGRRRSGRGRQGEADRFRHAGHRVGGELSAAGAGAGAGRRFELVKLGVGHLAGRVLPDPFEDVDDGDVAALEPARQDRSPVNEHRGDVEAHHRHHHPREGLVAARQPDQSVVAMAAHGEFDGIGDDLPAHQRGLHAVVTHRDAVGDGDRRELARRAAGVRDAALGRLRLARQRDVAGRGLVPAGRHADQGLMNLLVGQAHRIEERAMRRALRPLGHMAAGKLRLVEAVRCSSCGIRHVCPRSVRNPPHHSRGRFG